MTKSTYRLAEWSEVLKWLEEGVIVVWEQSDGFVQIRKRRIDGSYYELQQRTSKRRNMEGGDARVDVSYLGKRRSCHVSQLRWMWETRCQIPPGWEIHHRDEDRSNNRFRNLLCLHPKDHQKFHSESAESLEVAEDGL